MNAQDTSHRLKNRSIALLGTALAVLFASQAVRSQSVWDQIADYIGLRGKPKPASANVLSEHEISALDNMTPQNQAILLLERSINHYRGANDQIAKRVNNWQGKVSISNELGSLFTTALYSDDLRVRAAAIEIEIASYGLPRTSASIDALENTARFGEAGLRSMALWKIGLLGNRGVEPHRAFEIISAALYMTATQRFDRGRSKDSHTWARMKPSLRCWVYSMTNPLPPFVKMQPVVWLNRGC